MQEFKIESEAKRHDWIFSILLWGAVLLLLASAALLLVVRISEVLFVLSALGSIVGASVLTNREVLHRAVRQTVFVMKDNEITQPRSGRPELRIAFSEVKSLREEFGYLVVKSDEPRKKIAIPISIKGYEAILVELAKHCSLSAPAEIPLRRLLLVAISFSSWTVFLRFTDIRIVILAGAIALAMLAVGSLRIWSVLRRTSKSRIMWTSLGFAWFLALLLVYFRVAQVWSLK